MIELEMILREHAARYPEMEPADAVKLIYQNEFGGGHIIENTQICLDRLRKEYLSVVKNPCISLYEEIGNRIVRVNLAALGTDQLEPLGMVFILSAQTHKGNLAIFLKKLETLRELTKAGTFNFDSETLNIYLKHYARAGFPAVSHSPQYREAYRPSYRIIDTQFAESLSLTKTP